MHDTLSGQSGGPPRRRSSARSLTLLRPSSAVFSAVTTNEFESTAGDGANGCSPRSARHAVNAVIVSSMSPVASVSSPLRNSSADAAYSAVKLMSPLSNDVNTMSRNPPRALLLDRVAVGRQRLAVDLSQDRALAEVLRTDDDRRPVGRCRGVRRGVARAGVARAGADSRRGSGRRGIAGVIVVAATGREQAERSEEDGDEEQAGATHR